MTTMKDKRADDITFWFIVLFVAGIMAFAYIDVTLREQGWKPPWAIFDGLKSSIPSGYEEVCVEWNWTILDYTTPEPEILGVDVMSDFEASEACQTLDLLYKLYLSDTVDSAGCEKWGDAVYILKINDLIVGRLTKENCTAYQLVRRATE